MPHPFVCISFSYFCRTVYDETIQILFSKCFYRDRNLATPNFKGSEKSLSEDANAQKLARRCKPDVVIGIKALQYIFASELNAQEDWIIPLNVVKFDEKIVYFIEDPLIMVIQSWELVPSLRM